MKEGISISSTILWPVWMRCLNITESMLDDFEWFYFMNFREGLPWDASCIQSLPTQREGCFTTTTGQWHVIERLIQHLRRRWRISLFFILQVQQNVSLAVFFTHRWLLSHIVTGLCPMYVWLAGIPNLYFTPCICIWCIWIYCMHIVYCIVYIRATPTFLLVQTSTYQFYIKVKDPEQYQLNELT